MLKTFRNENTISLIKYIRTDSILRKITNFFICLLKIKFLFFFTRQKNNVIFIHFWLKSRKVYKTYNFSSIYGVFNRIRVKKAYKNHFFTLSGKNCIKKKQLQNCFFLIHKEFYFIQKTLEKHISYFETRIDIRGMGHTVMYFKERHKLIFKIGFSKKKVFFLPSYVNIVEAHKYYLRLSSYDKTKLLNICLQIKHIKYPHTYKILGLYFDREYNKIKLKPIVKKK